MGEFDLIKQFFTRPTPRAVLGVGDDCALLQPRAGMQTAISCDMLVEGRHFFPDVDPKSLGHKALAVNLSDLAACGAEPVAFTLALALPQANEAWLQAFSEGLLQLADAHGCELIGGDTTRGPLNICITVFGEVPAGQALLRSGAQVGDDIWVSGSLGDARLALEHRLGTLDLPATTLVLAQQRLELPTPRVALGMALRGIATACADVSDGLLGDLGHILERSGMGAELQADALYACMATQGLPPGHAAQRQLEFVCAGGDDYELVFTAPPGMRAQVDAAATQSHTPVHRIGRIVTGPGARVVDTNGALLQAGFQSFDHFGN